MGAPRRGAACSCLPALWPIADTPGYLGIPQAGSQWILLVDSCPLAIESSLRESHLLLEHDVFRAQDTKSVGVGVITFSQATSKCHQHSHNVVLQRALLTRAWPHFRAGDSELHSPEMLMGF